MNKTPGLARTAEIMKSPSKSIQKLKLMAASKAPFLVKIRRAIFKEKLRLTETKSINRRLAAYNTASEQLKSKLMNTKDKSNLTVCEVFIDDSSTSEPGIFVNETINISETKRWIRATISTNENETQIVTISSLTEKLNDYEIDYFFLLEKGCNFVEATPYFVFDALSTSSQPPKLIYTDHIEKFSKSKVNHYCKPDWSPDYLLCFNYIGDFVAFHKTLIPPNHAINKKSLSNSKFNLMVNNISNLTINTVLHIPKLLGHKSLSKPTQSSEDQELKTVNNFLRSCNLREARATDTPMVREVDYQPLCSHQLASSTIIIPTKNEYRILKNCIDSIFKSDISDQDDILIINNSSDCPKTIRYLNELSIKPRIRVVDYNKEFNYSAINNLAATKTSSDILIFLNNDTEIISYNWIKKLKACANLLDAGAVGAKLYYPDGEIQHGGVILGYGGVADHAFKYESKHSNGYMNRLITNQNYSAVTAACMAIKRTVFQELNGFDQTNLTVAFNDIDLCLKAIESGLRNIWLPNVKIIHHESKSRGSDTTAEKLLRFRSEINYMKNKWATDRKPDPFYNPNLSLRDHTFKIETGSYSASN